MRNAAGSPLVEHKGLGTKVRRGGWREQQASTYDLCLQAMADKRWKAAAELAAYTLHEAREPHELYRDWIPQIREFLRQRGVPAEALAEDEAALLERLRDDSGRPFDPEAGWREAEAQIGEAVASCQAEDPERAATALERSRQVWLVTHDRKCDWVQGMIAMVAKHLGEDCIGELWDLLMAPMFESYDKYDVDRTPWPVSAETLLLVTAEALRGHLSGPERRGDIEYVEEPGRRGFRFDPCGSGGRNFTGAKTPDFPLTQGEHDWAWNTKGVCLYCAHCCALSERNPISRFGYPARVVEPPFRNESGQRDRCTWWVYDDPRDVPAEVYRRTGNAKPGEIGGAATARRAAGRGGEGEAE